MLYVKFPTCVTRKTATLYYKQSITLFAFTLTHPASDIFGPYLVFSIHRNAFRIPFPLLNNAEVSRKTKTDTEFLFKNKMQK